MVLTSTTKKEVWGKHAVVDASGCDYNAIRNIKWIEEFVDELIEKSKMQKWGKMFYMDLENTDETTLNDTAGFSVCQFITTSNITIHFANVSKSMYLDFFSCKDFDEQIVIDLVNKYFSPNKIKIKCFNRDALQD